MTVVMPEVEVDPLVLEDIEQSLPCDYDNEDGCQNVARWVLFGAPCCPGSLSHSLACDHCKEVRMTTDDAVECDLCGEVFAPARKAYSRIEAL